MKEFSIDKSYINVRLDKYLRKILPDTPLSLIYKYIRTGKIKINNKKIKISYKLNKNDKLSVIDSISIKQFTESAPNLNKFDILYKDDYLALISKPRYITVQPGIDKNKKSISGMLKTSGIFSPSPVHRLDFETTGALLISLKRNTSVNLSSAFRNGLITKYYLAKVSGIIPQYMEISSDLDNKSAETSVYPVSGNSENTVVLVNIKTGRKHQIRKHLSLNGFPIIGDRKYSKNIHGKEPLHLHSFYIGFKHPESDIYIETFDENIDWLDNKYIIKAKQYIKRINKL